MKKIYQNPKIKIVMVQPALMQATSQIGTGEYTGGVIQSREGGSFWDDSDDEDY